MADAPGRLLSATLAGPGSPFGFGGTRDARGTPTTPDYAGSGGGLINPDLVKSLLAGADVTHLCAALLQNGPGYVAGILSGMERWMELYEYESVDQLKGSVCRDHASDPSAYERANYIEMLKQY